MNFFEYLDDLCIYLDDKYNINNGGCCFVAYCIAFELEQRNIPFKVYICDEDLDKNTAGHYAIEVNNILINQSDWGKCDFDTKKKLKSKTLLSRYKKGNWNCRYSKRWNLIVKTKIHSKFLEYDNHRERFYDDYRI